MNAETLSTTPRSAGIEQGAFAHPRARRYLLPPFAATIERRLLVGYRLDPDVARTLLPASLRPHLVDGSAVAGFCAMRLGSVRPAFARTRLGWRGESAAHRIAVQWDDTDADGRAIVRSGVYVPIRHSAARFPTVIGGRVFPGVQRRAHFDITDTPARSRIAFSAPDVQGRIDVEVTDTWSSTLFATVDDASAFNRDGNVAWSPTRASRSGSALDCLSLHTDAWRVTPGRVLDAESSFFTALPAGSAVLDHALVMQGVPMRWGTTP
jgi:hypothetical protein